jgi:hypothetical protein
MLDEGAVLERAANHVLAALAEDANDGGLSQLVWRMRNVHWHGEGTPTTAGVGALGRPFESVPEQ